MNSGFFITGTDTDVGKTWVSVALLRKFRRQGYTVAGMKPVAAGCEWRDDCLRNGDALLLQANSVPQLNYSQINPYAFAMPVSPHLACGEIQVNLAHILDQLQTIRQRADWVLVEGAGGWLSPLSSSLDNAGLAVALQLPVIMVVALRLGCLNHARLTYQAVCQQGLPCAGWVAVEIEAGRTDVHANLDYLRRHIAAPLLGVMPYQAIPDFDVLADNLSF
ncbi:dethiobiotin synthase [Methylomonas paludis]|uniref:ATP-dependent dethiobiotin synthetase BioD n=1 Tax=Methylomonas paludis TaxID=1173101 RepID=A0A975MN74_9GAMM|nr:dethiobiotin synthase [Methylomonas paludis]QWF70419.1 dethiobiotin synthase [Methylomonas paludis]